MDKPQQDQNIIRHFSQAVKRPPAQEFDAKLGSVSQVVGLYQVTATALYRWWHNDSLTYHPHHAHSDRNGTRSAKAPPPGGPVLPQTVN